MLAVVGTLGGAFSGLFGVGGGIVMVPLLILWAGFDERRATGTSLAAIVIIAGVAASVQAIYGNVHLDEGVLVGVPAVGGVLFGTWLQQRIAVRWISLGFAALLVAAAAMLTQGAYGNVHVGDGMLVGIPAIGGTLVGTALQQRVSERAVSAAFAVLLVVSAALLVV